MRDLPFIKLVLLYITLGLSGVLIAQSDDQVLNQAVKSLALKPVNGYELTFSYYEAGASSASEVKEAIYIVQKEFESILFLLEDQTTLYTSEGLLQVDDSEKYLAYHQEASLSGFMSFSALDSLRSKASSITLKPGSADIAQEVVLEIADPYSPYSRIVFGIGASKELKTISMFFKPQENKESERLVVRFQSMEKCNENQTRKLNTNYFLRKESDKILPTKEFAGYELYLL